HQIGTPRLPDFNSGFSVGCFFHLMSSRLKDPVERAANQHFVINDEDFHEATSPSKDFSATIGSKTRKRAPLPGSDSQIMSPPNRRTKSRLKLNPRPVP